MSRRILFKTQGLISWSTLAWATLLFAASWPVLAGSEPQSNNPAYLGVVVRRPDPVLLEHISTPKQAGLVVTAVSDNSPAEKAGIRVHDILVMLNDQLLYHPEQLKALIQSFKPGDKVKILLIRRGKEVSVEVILGSAPKPQIQKPDTAPSHLPAWRAPLIPPSPPFPPEITPFQPKDQPWRQWRKQWEEWMDRLYDELKDQLRKSPFDWQAPPRQWRLGLALSDPDPALLAQLGRSESEGGALVVKVIPGSPADRAGIKPYDLIIEINDKPVRTPSDLVDAVSRLPADAPITLKLIREGKPLTVTVRLSNDKTTESTEKPARGLVKRKHRQSSEGSEKQKTDRVVHPPLRQTVIVMNSPEGTATVLSQDGFTQLTVTDSSGQILYHGNPDKDPQWKELPDSLRTLAEKAMRQAKQARRSAGES